MVKKTLLAASLLLAVGAGRPASADPKFLEPYGNIFAARTFLAAPGDDRPKDALQGQESKVQDPQRRLILSPFFRTGNALGTDVDVDYFGVGVGYASVANPRHPWSLSGSYYNVEADFGPFDVEADVFDIVGKFVLWQGANPSTPAISAIGRYQAFSDDIDDRIDVLLAADQRITDSIFLTANVGWADQDENDFVAGIGGTWRAPGMPKLSLSLDYQIDNDLDQEDFWTLSALYAIDRTSTLRVGGGKHNTWFFNYFAKWDWAN